MADNPTWNAPSRPVAKTLLSAPKPPQSPSSSPTYIINPLSATAPSSSNPMSGGRFGGQQYTLPAFDAPTSTLDRKSRSARVDPSGPMVGAGSRSVRQPAPQPSAPSSLVAPLPSFASLSPKPPASSAPTNGSPSPSLNWMDALQSTAKPTAAPTSGMPVPPLPGRQPVPMESRPKAETLSTGAQLPASIGHRERTMSIMGDIEKEKEDASNKRDGVMSKINKRGKSQERYFRLYGTSLTWTKTPTDKTPLGTIDLHAAQLELRTEKSMFMLKATKKGKTKEYLLACSHEELANQWIRAITAAQQRKSFQMGWMQRKKKALWFLLADDSLLAFPKEQDPYSDYKRNVLDTVKLYECIIAPNVSDPLAFELWDNKSKPPTSHSFVCKSEIEQRLWMEALKAVILKHTHRVVKQRSEKYGWLKKKGKKCYCVLSEGRLSWYAAPEDVTPKGSVQLDDYGVRPDAQDILSFVLFCHTNPDLAYVFATSDVEDLGSWTGALQRAAERAKAKRGMQIDEVRAAAVNAQAKVAKSGWALLKGKRRWVRLRDTVLMWLEDQPGEDGGNADTPAVHGSVNLFDCSLYLESDFVWVMRQRDGKEYAFQNQSKQEAAEWVACVGASLEQARGLAYAQSAGRAIDPRFQAMLQGEASKRGQVQHKSKPMRLELRPGELAVLALNNKEQETLHRLIPLEGCSIALFARSAFVLTTPTKAWTFDTTNEEAQKWVDALALAVVHANEAVEKGLEHKGWLQLKGVYYWCALKHGRFYAFAEQQGFSSIDDAHARKAFDASACRIERSKDEPLVLEVYPPPKDKDKEARPMGAPAGGVSTPFQLLKDVKGSMLQVTTIRGNKEQPPKRLLFRAHTPQEASEWLEALVPAKVEKKPLGPRVPIFGTDLSSLLTFEKTLGQQGDVPFVVKRILEYLAPHVSTTRSLFQGQVSFPKIREMQAHFNAGDDVNFLQYTVHDIGGLLKQFLRLMPEPLIPYKHYRSALMHSENWRELRKICADFLPPHKALTRYLFRFFHSVQAQQDVGIVAMIFGPIVLRAPDNEPDDDTALLRAVECVRTLVSAYREVWELSEEEVTRSVGADFDMMLRKLIEGKDTPAVVRARGMSEAGSAGINSLDQLFSELQAEKMGESLGRSTLLSSTLQTDGAGGREMLRAMITNNKEHVRALEQMAKDGRVVQTGIDTLDDLLAEMRNEKKAEMTQRKTNASGSNAVMFPPVATGAPMPSFDASLFAIGAGARRNANRPISPQKSTEPEPSSALSEFDDILGELSEERAMRRAPSPPFAGRTRTGTATHKPQLTNSGSRVLDAEDKDDNGAAPGLSPRNRTRTFTPQGAPPLPALNNYASSSIPSPTHPDRIALAAATPPIVPQLSPRGVPMLTGTGSPREPSPRPRGDVASTSPQLSPRGVDTATSSEMEAIRAKQEARKKRAQQIAAQRAEAEQRLKSLENQLEQLKSDMAPGDITPGDVWGDVTLPPPVDPMASKTGVYSSEVEDLLADM